MSFKKMHRVGVMTIVACLGFISGCASRTWNKEEYQLIQRERRPADEATIAKAKAENSRDSVAIALEHSFALLRYGQNIERDIRMAKSHIEEAYKSFEDLRDPKNLSIAFTPDRKVPYRGRPHERVFAAAFLALIDISEGRCDLALPALRNAAFLDARWQEMKFGTDSPIVYLMSLYCMHQRKSAPSDIRRAELGLSSALRLRELSDIFRKTALQLKDKVEAESTVEELFFQMFELALPHELVNGEAGRSVEQLLLDIFRQTPSQLWVWESKLDETGYSRPFKELAKKENFDLAQKNAVENFAVAKMEIFAKGLASQVMMMHQDEHRHQALKTNFSDTKNLRQRLLLASEQDRLTIVFSGEGPTVTQFGQYKEIARIQQSPHAASGPSLSKQKVHYPKLGCGWSRGDSEQLILVLCGASKKPTAFDGTAVGVWSASYQATSVAGRRFDQVLKGRATFKKTSEAVGGVGMLVAETLLSKASRGGQGSEAAAVAGAVVGLVALGVWIAGAAVNSEADPRYVRTLFENAEVLVSDSP